MTVSLNFSEDDLKILASSNFELLVYVLLTRISAVHWTVVIFMFPFSVIVKYLFLD